MGWLRKYQGSRLALAGLCVAAVLFVAVNVLSSHLFGGAQADLTEGKLYTLSDGTRRVMANIDEPITLRLYFSRNLADLAPRYASYYERIRELLERYAHLSGGKLQIQLLSPEPFSDAEDMAVADGLQGVPISQAGDVGYFGIAGSNSTDGRAVIPFFNADREPFIEYDLTKLVYGLANPDHPKIGVISALSGGPGPRGSSAPEPVALFDQINEFFTVETIEPTAGAIPPDVKTVMVLNLQGLAPETLRALDRFVHDGGNALVFVDTFLESNPHAQASEEASQFADVQAMLAAWGLKITEGKVVGDLDAARRVSTTAPDGRTPIIGDYVAWLALSRDNFDTADPVMANIEQLNMATASVIEPAETPGLKVTPLVFTGPRSMAIGIEQVRFSPDIVGLLRRFQPRNTPMVLAARISGDAAAAFTADGTPAASAAPAAGDAASATSAPQAAPPASSGAAPEASQGSPSAAAGTPSSAAPATADRKPINVIVVADADMLYDRFWVQSSDFFGQRVNVPTAGNGDLVMNALENLTDGEALSGLRGRGTSYRPFALVEEIRRDAEAQYRAKEEQLQQRLHELQQQLDGIQQRQGPGSEIVLSAEDKAAIERFRGEMLTVRRELRDVQHALRSDIESLEEEVKFVNIAAVPIVLCGVGGVLALLHRLRRGRAKQRTQRQ